MTTSKAPIVLNSNDKTKKQLQFKDENSTIESSPESKADKNKKKKPFQERAGDWVCVKCKNLNFSFRNSCNRCQLLKNDSEKLYEQYMSNLMNYIKVNETMQTGNNFNNNNNNKGPINMFNNQAMNNRANEEMKNAYVN